MLKECTPGPWRVVIYDCGDKPHYYHNGPCPSIQASEEQDCAVVHWDGFKQKYWSSANGNQKQIEANARLMAAAPEMALVNWARDRGVWFFDWDGSTWSVQEWDEDEDGSEMVNEWICPDNGFNCPALPEALFKRLRAEMEAGG